MNKKVLVTLASGTHAEYAELTKSRLIQYGKNHGYDVQIFGEPLTNERSPLWSKILIIQKMFLSYEFVLWIDSDAVIVDLSTDIFDEIDVDETELAIVEHSTWGQTHLNAGIMLIRRTNLMSEFLATVWDQVDLIHHTWAEQAAILRCLGIDSKKFPIGPGSLTSKIPINVKFLDKKWNAIRQDYPQGSIKIRHFAGENHETRKFLISSLTLDNSNSRENFEIGIKQVNEFAAYDRAISERNSAIVERDNAILERDQLLASKSWKLTKPLRSLYDRLFG